MTHLNSRDYGFVSPSANFQVLNSETEFHRFNREARFRRNVTVAACVMALVAVALFSIIVFIQQG